MKDESIDIVTFHEGDVDTFDEIFHRNYTSVFYFARKMTGNAVVAEDIAMDSFRKLWTRRKDFPTRTAIKAWLMITTKNACLTHLTSEKKRIEVANGLKHLELQRQDDENKNYTLLQETVIHILHREINKLPRQCRIIIKLRLGGFSSREISKLMGISISTVKNQKVIAFKRLRLSLLDIEHLVLFLLYVSGLL